MLASHWPRLGRDLDLELFDKLGSGPASRTLAILSQDYYSVSPCYFIASQIGPLPYLILDKVKFNSSFGSLFRINRAHFDPLQFATSQPPAPEVSVNAFSAKFHVNETRIHKNIALLGVRQNHGMALQNPSGL